MGDSHHGLDLAFGQKIKVYINGAQLDGTGSFIAFRDETLIWSQANGDIMLTHYGDGVTIELV